VTRNRNACRLIINQCGKWVPEELNTMNNESFIEKETK